MDRPEDPYDAGASADRPPSGANGRPEPHGRRFIIDNAVALVQAYFRVNGYFTVAEYPVIEAAGGASHRSVTDIDILAFRFAHTGHASARTGRKLVEPEMFPLDPALRHVDESSDMVVGEVKEGKTRLNAAARDPAVLQAALTRFGCCTPDEAGVVVDELARAGKATTGAGHRIRIVAFGSTVDEQASGFTTISLGHVVRYLEEYLRQRWDVVRHVQTKEPVLGLLLALEKARRGDVEEVSTPFSGRIR